MAPKAKQLSLVDPSILRPAILESFKKLAPQLVAKNPVMFVVEIGSILTTAIWLRDVLSPSSGQAPTWFTLAVAIWLWFTVVFANFAEAVAEGRGKAQAETLRRMRQDTVARKVRFWPPTDDVPGISNEDIIPASRLKKGDLVIVDAGQVIPGDGEVIEGIASVDESAITGESAPVIRESGGDRSAVTGGTKVLSDRIVVRITVDPGGSFLDRMIGLVEGAARQKTPNEIALHILLVGLTIVFLFACVTLVPLGLYSGIRLGATAVVALLVCLIPTTIGGLLSAIGIAGMDRLLQRNVLAMSGRAVEAAGDVDVLRLDKTGTITLGNRQATRFAPLQGVDEREVAHAAMLSSLSDETPEGRSIVELAKERYGFSDEVDPSATFIPFSAMTRMSGVDLNGAQGGNRAGSPVQTIRKGAGEAVATYVTEHGGATSDELRTIVNGIASAGSTPLVVAETQAGSNGAAEKARVLGVIELKDIVKGGMRERFGQLRRMGIRTIMITG